MPSLFTVKNEGGPKDQRPVVVYTPESQLRSPRMLIRAMWRELRASRELAWRLMVRDISVRYRQSVLGILWAFLPPIATTAVFVVLNREGAINVTPTDVPYPAFVMFGAVLWQVFIDSLNAPLKAVMGNIPMLAKINFPREALILSALGQVLFDFGIRLIILIGVFVVFRLPVTAGLLLAPFAILMLILLGIMIGLLLTPIGVLYTDVSQLLTTITGLWFFVTPVVYPPPHRWPYSVLINFNPVSPLLVGARELATKGMLPDVWPFTIVSALTLFGLLAMWVLYRVSLPIVIERMSA